MQEPVGGELRGQLLFAGEDLLPAVGAIARQRLDATQPATQIARRDLDRPVGGFVVAQVSLYAVGEEVLQTAADKTLLVVGGDDGHDPRRHGADHSNARSGNS
jgi:hypothetical protein